MDRKKDRDLSMKPKMITYFGRYKDVTPYSGDTVDLAELAREAAREAAMMGEPGADDASFYTAESARSPFGQPFQEPHSSAPSGRSGASEPSGLGAEGEAGASDGQASGREGGRPVHRELMGEPIYDERGVCINAPWYEREHLGRQPPAEAAGGSVPSAQAESERQTADATAEEPADADVEMPQAEPPQSARTEQTGETSELGSMRAAASKSTPSIPVSLSDSDSESMASPVVQQDWQGLGVIPGQDLEGCVFDDDARVLDDGDARGDDLDPKANDTEPMWRRHR